MSPWFKEGTYCCIKKDPNHKLELHIRPWAIIISQVWSSFLVPGGLQVGNKACPGAADFGAMWAGVGGSRYGSNLDLFRVLACTLQHGRDFFFFLWYRFLSDKFTPGSNVGGWRLSGLGVNWHFLPFTLMSPLQLLIWPPETRCSMRSWEYRTCFGRRDPGIRKTWTVYRSWCWAKVAVKVGTWASFRTLGMVSMILSIFSGHLYL